MSPAKVTVVGAGISGLIIASYLVRNGADVTMIEQKPYIGGAISTDHLNGFYLDRRFYPFYDNSPELKRVINTDNLQLKHFNKGFNFIVSDGSEDSHRLSGPPTAAFGTFADLKHLTPKDWLGVGRLFWQILRNQYPLGAQLELERADALIARLKRINPLIGNFASAIAQVSLPHGGQLSSSSDLLEAIPQYFLGNLSLPGTGIAEIPSQIASTIDMSHIALDTKATAICDEYVTLADGNSIGHDFAVLTCDARTLLLDSKLPETKPKENSSANFGSGIHYFATEADISTGSTIQIPTYFGSKIALAVAIDEVAPNYAPKGTHLLSISTTHHELDANELNREVSCIFGIKTSDLVTLRSYWHQADVETAERSSNFAANPNSYRISNRVFQTRKLYSPQNVVNSAARILAEQLLYQASK